MDGVQFLDACNSIPSISISNAKKLSVASLEKTHLFNWNWITASGRPLGGPSKQQYTYIHFRISWWGHLISGGGIDFKCWPNRSQDRFLSISEAPAGPSAAGTCSGVKVLLRGVFYWISKFATSDWQRVLNHTTHFFLEVPWCSEGGQQ